MTRGGKREGAGRPLKHKSHGVRVNVYLPEYQIKWLREGNMSAKIQQSVQSQIEQQVHDQISRMGFTQQQLDFIWAYWSNTDEHVAWLLTASKEEIDSWGAASEWGVVEKEEF